MSGHQEARCKTPTTVLRRVGSLWACDCGRVWVVARWYGYEFSGKRWERFKKGVTP